jgi:hypothetical protein
MYVYLLLQNLMKKIAITGHTGEVGGAIARAYASIGYEIIGISRSTGFDILRPDHRLRILDAINLCDVFVNSAHVGMEQLSLLESVGQMWAGQLNLLIINVSSIDADFDSKVGDYFDQKRLLDKMHWRLIESRIGPVACLAKAGKSEHEENFNYWATELVTQLEQEHHYMFEFSILRK